jgi:hypothetical protein
MYGHGIGFFGIDDAKPSDKIRLGVIYPAQVKAIDIKS